jgi:hypothetical protein
VIGINTAITRGYGSIPADQGSASLFHRHGEGRPRPTHDTGKVARGTLAIAVSPVTDEEVPAPDKKARSSRR